MLRTIDRQQAIDRQRAINRQRAIDRPSIISNLNLSSSLRQLSCWITATKTEKLTKALEEIYSEMMTKIQCVYGKRAIECCFVII